jgi:hypothetical protein
MRQLAKKGQAGGFLGFVTSLGIGVVTIVVLAIMLNALQGSQTANSYAYNITGDGLTFLDNTTSQFGTAGTVLGVSLLLVIIGGIGFAGYQAYKNR